MEYHVYQNSTTKDNSFSSISQAMPHLKPNDVLTVHKGIYREWVNPIYGGNSDAERITIQSAKGETVVITGSEQVDDWKKTEDGIWLLTVSNSFFAEYNPYLEELSGDWFDGKNRVHHTGEVYLNGKSLFEMETIEKVIKPTEHETAQCRIDSLCVWYCEVDENNTYIWANFLGKNPNEHCVEINVRPYCFWPEKTGINYITVNGFTMKQAATQWAPPTALQVGLIGPHWSKGWIIENNVISDSKCSGISLGKSIDNGQNEWTRFKNKHGTQREREVVFKAIHDGWNKDTIGSHIVRNNTISNCEQTGICGHMGCAFSVIENNTIFDIHTKHLFEGAEIGGIKVHAAIDTFIRNNRLINCFRGLWLDWQAQGTRVSQNLFARNSEEDMFIEVSHGPYVVDNNIFLSHTNFRDFSQGGAFLHNLFTGKFVVGKVKNRFTQYHFPHETAVMGLMTILGGDNRFYNNVFSRLDTNEEIGLFCYNEYPTPYDAEKQYDNIKFVPAYADVSLAMYCGNNLYLNGAKSFKAEENSLVESEFVTVSIANNKDVVLTTDFGKYLPKVQCTKKITTQYMGIAFQPEVCYENADGSPLSIDYDYFGNKIKDTNPLPGPFANLQEGLIGIKL